MVSTDVQQESPVSGTRLSSVVPAKATGGNEDFQLSDLDLAMKLHYIKGVYFFSSQAAQGLTTAQLKEPMFRLLQFYYPTAGRIRKSDATGRPFIKCNDGGVRIVEAHSDKTIDEWLAMKNPSLDHQHLAFNQVLGPDLGFSPLVFVQFTWFKCGGFAIGLSWAHVLGDTFSAAAFINMWGKILAADHVPTSLHLQNPRKTKFPAGSGLHKDHPLLFPLRKVNPVGDLWFTANKSKIQTHSIHLTAKELHHLVSSITCDPSRTANISSFEILSAIIWKSLSKIRDSDSEDKNMSRILVVRSSNSRDLENEMPSNGIVLSRVEAERSSVAKGDIAGLASLVAEKEMSSETVDYDDEGPDFLVYGSNLTFVNLEESNIYGLEVKGQKPVFVNYIVNGIGDEGTVLFLPGRPTTEKGDDNGRMVTLLLPEDQLLELKNELRREWNLV